MSNNKRVPYGGYLWEPPSEDERPSEPVSYTEAQILGQLKGYSLLKNPAGLMGNVLIKYFKITENGYIFKSGGFLIKNMPTYMQIGNRYHKWYIKNDPKVNIIFYRFYDKNAAIEKKQAEKEKEKEKKQIERKEKKRLKELEKLPKITLKKIENYSYESSYSLPEEIQFSAPKKKVIKNGGGGHAVPQNPLALSTSNKFAPKNQSTKTSMYKSYS